MRYDLWRREETGSGTSFVRKGDDADSIALALALAGDVPGRYEVWDSRGKKRASLCIRPAPAETVAIPLSIRRRALPLAN